MSPCRRAAEFRQGRTGMAAAGACWAALLLLLLCVPVNGVCKSLKGGGSWEVLVENAGIASMHTAVTHKGNVVLLDRNHIGHSLLPLASGACRNNHTIGRDCTAHSALFTPGPNSVRPLTIVTDTWCSSGQFTPDGTLVQTGGNANGSTKIRLFVPCTADNDHVDSDLPPPCDWLELPYVALQDSRWYSTNQLLPDGTQFVLGGRNVSTYEFVRLPFYGGIIPFYVPPTPKTFLPFLNTSNDAQSDVLYPFVHLLPDGNLFIFANRYSIVYDYHAGSVVRTLPEIPGEPRNYPSAGSSVLLPLPGDDVAAAMAEAEVLVCGGAPRWCNAWSVKRNASRTCGRIKVGGGVGPVEWEMEEMPFCRAMGDMLFLPTADVLIINGAQKGCQGFDKATEPAYFPLIYRQSAASGERFTVQNPSEIPRLYHSTANLLPDGRVLVAGSNPHLRYNFTAEFPTELRLESFSPDYLNPAHVDRRPVILRQAGDPAHLTLSYGQPFYLCVAAGTTYPSDLKLTLVSSPFTTHSFSQGLRLLRLPVWTEFPFPAGRAAPECRHILVRSLAPVSPALAPPSYYMLFAVHHGIPSNATWVRLVF